MKTIISDAEMSQIRGACYHEAGHAAMAILFGSRAKPDVWRNPGMKEGFEVYGKCHYSDMGDRETMRDTRASMRRAGFRCPRLPYHWRTMVGMAGEFADAIWLGHATNDDIICHVERRLEHDEVSDTDLEAFEYSRGYDTQEACIEILRANWSVVHDIAEKLITGVCERGVCAFEYGWSNTAKKITVQPPLPLWTPSTSPMRSAA